MTRLLKALALMAATCVVLFAGPAAACYLPTPAVFQPDAKFAVAGETAPPAPIVAVSTIQRGEYHPNKTYTGCADIGYVELVIPADDASRKLAYEFDVVSGETRDDIFHNGVAFTTDYEDDGKLHFFFAWFDGTDETQEPLDLKVQVTAITRSGLRSPATEIAIRDPGRR